VVTKLPLFNTILGAAKVLVIAFVVALIIMLGSSIYGFCLLFTS